MTKPQRDHIIELAKKRLYLDELIDMEEAEYFTTTTLPKTFLASYFKLTTPFHSQSWIQTQDANGRIYIEIN